MKGTILNRSNYEYKGDIVDGDAHGNGRFNYVNGDVYIGSCKFGQPHGFGRYLFASSGTYEGFHSYGKSHGIGTYEDNRNIYKGNWHNGKKYGMFYRTRKSDLTTYLQKWINGKRKSYKQVQYIQPDALKTTKKSPKKKRLYTEYKGRNPSCIGCLTQPTNAANSYCGHVVMCHDCLDKCDSCPICRAPIYDIIKLFVS